MTLAVAISVVAFSPAPAEQKGPAIQSTPLTMPRRHPMADVLLNGNVPLRFVVDTAAGATVVDRNIAESLGLMSGGMRQEEVHGANGSASHNLVKVNRVTLAGMSRENVDAVIVDMERVAPGADGIIGNDVLRHYGVLFDMPNQKLVLSSMEEPAATAKECAPNARPGRMPGMAGFALLDGELIGDAGSSGKASATMIVDTGAAQTVLNWHAARALGLTPQDPRVRKRENGTRGLAAGAAGIETYLYTLGGMRLPGWTVPPLEVRIADLPVFKATQLDAEPAIILGADVLKQRAFTISRGAGRTCFLAA
ncbi:aspartyl protease family protein [Allosphingosinicella flava]|uniref:Aspartyl protease family protein n=1 Tax=Allosphingosinicella flava TaxID=2771430 RepID=A0A7T2LLM3_9SPHN|nr:retroviral-like aspartic protease family protein [Sphingosinicella flava]QPQ54594.1 aspartyl protease family protein [Sphingosinicella flava]